MNARVAGLRIAGSIFGIVALFHLLRIITAPSVMIAGWELPLWMNWIGFFATTALCVWLWVISADRGK